MIEWHFVKISSRIERYFARYQVLTIPIMVSLVSNVRIMMSVVVVIVNCALIADIVTKKVEFSRFLITLVLFCLVLRLGFPPSKSRICGAFPRKFRFTEEGAGAIFLVASGTPRGDGARRDCPEERSDGAATRRDTATHERAAATEAHDTQSN